MASPLSLAIGRMVHGRSAVKNDTVDSPCRAGEVIEAAGEISVIINMMRCGPIRAESISRNTKRSRLCVHRHNARGERGRENGGGEREMMEFGRNCLWVTEAGPIRKFMKGHLPRRSG